MRAIKLILITLFVTTSSLHSQEVTASKFGKGLLNINAKDSTFSMNISARMQFLTSSTWSESDDYFVSPESNFLVRRARLKFKGFAYSP